MGALMRAADWRRTPLGPPETWPQSLKTAVGIMLSSRYAMFVWWGRELINLYNDAYRSNLGKKHPQALGQSAREVWAEIWHLIGPRTEAVLERAESTFDEALLLIMERFGYPEETYFTFSYSPIRTDNGEVGGLFCAVTDETARVIGERRLKLLREVAARAPANAAPEQVCRAAAECISGNPRDLPFALLYLTEASGTTARLVAESGASQSSAMRAAARIELEDPQSVWPLGEARSGPLVVEDLASRFDRVPTGAWDRSPATAVIVPFEQAQTGTAGFLVAGLNPYLPFAEEYRGFVTLLAGQIGAGIANARAYQDERRRAEALAEIDRAKTAFFSNVSHEFRTPLTLMLGPLEEALAAPAQEAPHLREQLASIHRNGLRLLRLVNSLLDFSRIEAGRVRASYEPVDLASFTAELASVFRAATEKAGLTLTVDCPPLDEPVFVDREMWEKIVLNLLSNAFKFTFEGEIRVALHAKAGQAVLRVSDTGTGISKAELPFIFERFHRVENARGRTHEGTGIGLALVQELVKLHKGSLAVESHIGQGTTFTIVLPFGTAHLPQDLIGRGRTLASTAVRADAYLGEALRWLPNDIVEGFDEDALVAGAPGTAERARVLLADDNADMRDYVSRLLAPAYDVIPVPDGEAALAAIARRPPDLILTDVMMPRLDGFALLQRIRADSALQDIPVIVLSARAAEEAKLEGLHTGADDYLVKPFSARELLARVSANLALSQLRRQNRRSEDRLRAIFETTPECIKIVARDGTLLHINPAGLAMVEAGSAGVVEGSSTLDLIAPEHRDAWQSCHQRVCEGERLSWQFDIVGLKGTRRPMETHAAPLRMPDGTTAQLAITLDISQRKRDEAALIVLNTTLEQRVAVEVSERMKAEAALRQAQKMEAIGHLTGGVAHDFNNLLHVIIGSLEGMKHRLARSSGLSPREVARSLDIAMRSAEKAAGLTQSLLAFSRRQPLEPRPIDLNRLIDGMSELLRRTLGESIMVGTVLSEGLWRVSADPNQLENAILNLAVNARDAMPNGGSLTIESANAVLDAGYAARHQTIEAGDYVMFAIRDTGIGMSQDVLAAAFDPFFTTKERGHGTGLGLSQVYGFVKQSDGHIKIKSAPGKGTTVRIYLPRIAGEHTAEDAPSVMSHAPEHRRETVLVVEDDEAVREISAAMLEELGYRVILAGDAEEALHRIDADGTIRLLFSDVGLPGGINGRQLARLALERSPRLKVLFTTGYAQDALVHHGRLDPGIELIAKPFSVASLANKISALLQGD